MRCVHLEEDGRCSGRYKGFGCIGERCRADKEPPCPHYVDGFYCRRFGRFGCVGLSKCEGSVDAYLRAVQRPKARA